MSIKESARMTLFMEQPRERYGRPFVASVFAHVLLLAFLLVDFSGSQSWEDQEGAGGDGPAGGGGGGGGRTVTYVALPAYQRPQAPEEPREQPTRPEEIVIPQAQIEQVEIVEHFEIPRVPVSLDAASILGRGAGEGGGAGAGPGSGGGIGSGQGTGIGSAVGSGTGGGDGDYYLPHPRKVVVPPLDNKPREVVGREYQIHFWVSATGEVLRVAISPRIRDASFRARFIDQLHNWQFNPAVRPDGTPIAAEVTVPVTL